MSIGEPVREFLERVDAEDRLGEVAHHHVRLREPWRYACPEGHRSIRRKSAQYYCNTCEQSYSGQPRDLKLEDSDGGEA